MTNVATRVDITYSKAGVVVVLTTPTGHFVTVDLGKVAKSVSMRKMVDRALVSAGWKAGPFLRYYWKR